MVFETLELRRLMSGTLVVQGTAGNDQLGIARSNATGAPVVVTDLATGAPTSYFGVDKVIVNLGKGDDTVFADLNGVSIMIHGGDGADSVSGSVDNGSDFLFFGNNGDDQCAVQGTAGTIVAFSGGNGEDFAFYQGNGTFIYDGGNGIDTSVDLGAGCSVICRVEI